MQVQDLSIKPGKSLRILQLPANYAGQASLLKNKFRELGHHCELWTLEQNSYVSGADRLIFSRSSSRIRRAFGLLRASAYVFGRWDAVVFNAGQSLFSQRLKTTQRSGILRLVSLTINLIALLLQRLEFGILRARSIKLFVIYQGDDLRQGDKSLELFDVSIASVVETGYYSPESDIFKRRQKQLMSKVCARTYVMNPDLFHFVQGEATFLPVISGPTKSVLPDSWRPSPRTLRVLHAPSHRGVKGTESVLAAVESLSQRGYDVELILVEGLSNDAALELYREADLVVDQLYAGWYGVFAVECMSMGLPVMAYIREQDLDFIPKQMRDELPVIRTSTGSLEADIERLLTGPFGQIEELGRRSQEYVLRWHNPVSTAAGLIEDFLSL